VEGGRGAGLQGIFVGLSRGVCGGLGGVFGWLCLMRSGFIERQTASIRMGAEVADSFGNVYLAAYAGCSCCFFSEL
jgi:hypothetical protein